MFWAAQLNDRRKTLHKSSTQCETRRIAHCVAKMVLPLHWETSSISDLLDVQPGAIISKIEVIPASNLEDDKHMECYQDYHA